jgi:glucose uptake protein GlcU
MVDMTPVAIALIGGVFGFFLGIHTTKRLGWSVLIGIIAVLITGYLLTIYP